MKKTVLMAVAGLMSLAACQNQTGYTVKGTAEGVADGEYVYLQDFDRRKPRSGRLGGSEKRNIRIYLYTRFID